MAVYELVSVVKGGELAGCKIRVWDDGGEGLDYIHHPQIKAQALRIGGRVAVFASAKEAHAFAEARGYKRAGS